MWKINIFFWPALVCSTLALSQQQADSGVEADRPNVIIILSDDQGYGDFSCHGNPVLQTPSLDQLYRESVRFSNFHVAPLCTPTRGQLMTGLDAMHNKAATVLTGRNILRRDIVTMPEVFRDNGYVTGMFGKWHLGNNYPDRPMDRGFDKAVWIKGWGLMSEIEYDNDYYETRYLDSLETRYSTKYCSNLWFDQAMQWMGEMADKKKPFFTYLALNAPHGPFYAPMQDYKVYKDQVDGEETASFLGMIRNIDRNFQRLDDWLTRHELKDNTLVVFMNDNGGTGGVDVYNAGMRDKKGSNYDGGHRAACFMRWPKGTLGQPRTLPYASEIQDLLPTFIELFGFKHTTGHSFDGKSLSPVLTRNEEMNNRMFVVQYGGHIKPEKYFSCVVWDSWRLVAADELYNLEDDPGQKNNLATENPEVLKKMKAFYEKWWKATKPEINEFVPLVIGSKQDPVIINSDYWESGAINTQWAVAQAAGDPRGGKTHIQVMESGKYRVQLSRWPFHLSRELTTTGPAAAVGGTKIREGKALPIQYGCVMLNDEKPVVMESPSGAKEITLEMDLTSGDHLFQAWFQDRNHEDLCGAYYVRIAKL